MKMVNFLLKISGVFVSLWGCFISFSMADGKGLAVGILLFLSSILSIRNNQWFDSVVRTTAMIYLCFYYLPLALSTVFVDRMGLVSMVIFSPFAVYFFLCLGDQSYQVRLEATTQAKRALKFRFEERSFWKVFWVLSVTGFLLQRFWHPVSYGKLGDVLWMLVSAGGFWGLWIFAWEKRTISGLWKRFFFIYVSFICCFEFSLRVEPSFKFVMGDLSLWTAHLLEIYRTLPLMAALYCLGFRSGTSE